mmetsp:Transcript_11513/g.26696  ORF Transcript_11513/g.26696 Transcript_11513/m.26696 type:complete len:278 (+) Transcript_11513:644-1477(+)
MKHILASSSPYKHGNGSRASSLAKSVLAIFPNTMPFSKGPIKAIFPGAPASAYRVTKQRKKPLDRGTALPSKSARLSGLSIITCSWLKSEDTPKLTTKESRNRNQKYIHITHRCCLLMSMIPVFVAMNLKIGKTKAFKITTTKTGSKPWIKPRMPSGTSFTQSRKSYSLARSSKLTRAIAKAMNGMNIMMMTAVAAITPDFVPAFAASDFPATKVDQNSSRGCGTAVQAHLPLVFFAMASAAPPSVLKETKAKRVALMLSYSALLASIFLRNSSVLP